MKRRSLSHGGWLGVMGLWCGSLWAASDGAVGPTSSGTLQVQVQIPDLVRITDLADIDLGTYSGDAGNLSGSSPACVRRNGPGDYQLTVTSGNGAFNLLNGSESLGYSVSWGGGAVTYGTPLTGLTPDSDSLGSCSPVADQLTVEVLGSALHQALPGSYSDTLTLMVAPE
ncbi:hypothetical protein [Halomonas salifodinae]